MIKTRHALLLAAVVVAALAATAEAVNPPGKVGGSPQAAAKLKKNVATMRRAKLHLVTYFNEPATRELFTNAGPDYEQKSASISVTFKRVSELLLEADNALASHPPNLNLARAKYEDARTLFIAEVGEIEAFFQQVGAQYEAQSEQWDQVVAGLTYYHKHGKGITTSAISYLKVVTGDSPLAVAVDVVWSGVSAYADAAIEGRSQDEARMQMVIAGFLKIVDNLPMDKMPPNAKGAVAVLVKDSFVAISTAAGKGVDKYASEIRAKKTHKQAQEAAQKTFVTSLGTTVFDVAYNQLARTDGFKNTFNGMEAKEKVIGLLKFVFELPWRLAIEPALDIIASQK